jgi:pimeloyl-ACP methyl ester carboxylesterase
VIAMTDIPLFRTGTPGLIPDAWILNAAAKTKAPPVVVVHGIKREVDQMADLLTEQALAAGRTVILPHFNMRHWKRYQMAACPNRADVALLSLMRALVVEGHVNDGPFDMAGFSGGAQFSHRFAWMYPGLVGRLCLAAPGWWTFPERDVAWPRGTGAPEARGGVQAVWLQANLRRFLDREIVVVVGTADTDRDRNLRAGVEIDAQQGFNRLERARNWVDAMQGAAHAAGLCPDITFDLLDGCGHSFDACVRRAALDRIFVVPCPALRQPRPHPQLHALHARNAA